MPDLAPARTRLALGLVAAMVFPAPAAAAPPLSIPPDLRRSAALCLGEALRLCPNALAAADHGLSCIIGKRRLLSAPCRTVYDQGARLLRGGDLHLRLRAPSAP